MKKIFRMALVFALAGATLMYTGCTKDYSEDINKLDGEISSLEGKYQDLLQQLSDAKTSLEAAYTAADQKLAGDFDKKIAEINAAIAKKADAAEIEAAMDQLKKDLMAEADKLQKSADALKKEVQDKLDEFYAQVSDELRTLVFVPDFYYDGVEATMYDFADFQAYNVDALKKNAKVPTVNVDGAVVLFKTEGEKLYGINKADGSENKASAKVKGQDDYTYYNYAQGQLGKATYDLNPSTFPVENAEWSFKKAEKINLKGEEKTWNPKFEGIEAADGQIVVTYSIENPECLSENLIAEDGKDTLNLIQLNAVTAEKNIASDWAAVFSSVDTLEHLVFAKENKYTTANRAECEYEYPAFPPIEGSKVLYATALDAIAQVASVQWQYNAGPLDLAKAIKIHLKTFEGVQEISLDELNDRFPGFTMSFEPVPYYVGDEAVNTTPESEYGELTAEGIFTPCYVKSENGKASKVIIEKDSADKLGISAVGRKPMVFVTLDNIESGKTFLAGYFVIEIVKEAKQAEENFFDVPSFGKVPFICAPAHKATTWHEFSYFVLEQLGVDYDEFVSDYKWEGVYGYETVLDPSDPKGKKTMEKFVKIQLGTNSGEDAVEPATSFPKDAAGNQAVPSYGTIAYTPNTTGATVNDAFTWDVDAQKIGAGNSKTLYLRFARGKYDIVYFALNAEVAPIAELDFNANKISNEWYDDIDSEAKNTVRINVQVPANTSTDVTDFSRLLTKFYIGQQPVTLGADADECYGPYFDGKGAPMSPVDVARNYAFYFSEAQPEINGIQLYVNIENQTSCTSEPYTVLYGPSKDNFQQVVMEDIIDPNTGAKSSYPKYDESKKVAEINPETGLITYSYADGDTFAKQLLNLWSYDEKEQAKMLYANVDIFGNYDDCEIAPQDDYFHVRFLRPLDVKFSAQDVAEESAVAGFNVEIAKFISGIVDWNHQDVIVKEPQKDNKGNIIKDKYTGYYIPNVIKGIDMYAYYQFTNLIIDLENAKRDHVVVGDDAKQMKMMDVYGEQRLEIGTVDADGIFTATGSSTLDITDFTSLKGAAINYKNTAAYVETFNMYIPVKIEYSWGTLNATLEINVKPTSETK